MIGLEKYSYRRVAAQASASLLLFAASVIGATAQTAPTPPTPPAYIVQSRTTLANNLAGATANFAVNSRGDFFAQDGGSQYNGGKLIQHLYEFPANGGDPIVIFTDASANGPNGVAVDPFDNLFLTEDQGNSGANGIDTGIYKLPYTNGTYPGPYIYASVNGTNSTPSSCNAYEPPVPPSTSNPAGTPEVLANTNVCTAGEFEGVAYYYWQPLGIAADGQGNFYFYANYDNEYYYQSLGIYACDPDCVQQTDGGQGTQLTPLGGQPGAVTGTIQSIAADYAGDVFYVAVDADGKNNSVFELPIASRPTNATHQSSVTFDTTYTDPYGIQVDHSGNLYVTDDTGIWEIPALESSGAPCQGGTDVCTLTASNKFKIVPLSGPPEYCYNNNNKAGPAVDTKGNIVYVHDCIGYEQSLLYKTSLWSALFPATPIGTAAATPPVFTILFNKATTLQSIAAVQGSSPATEFALTPGTCVAGTAFAADSTCTFSVSFTPSAPGTRSGAVLVTDSTGAVTTTVLSGVGTGTAITVDPGTPKQIGGTFKQAMGLAVDTAGDVYIADSTANTVTEYPAGGGAAVSIGTGLVNPTGVAVDAAGNVFIVNQGTGDQTVTSTSGTPPVTTTTIVGTGSVVEVPSIAGVLTNSAQTTLISAIQTPTDIVVDTQDNLYITSTTGNTVLQYSGVNRLGSTAAPVSIGYLLNGPTGLAIDASNNIYVADTGDNQVLQLGDDSQTTVGNGLTAPVGVAVDASGSVVIADGSGRIVRVPNEGGKGGIGLNQADQQVLDSPLQYPYSVRLDGAGNLYVSDNNVNQVYELQRAAGTIDFGDWNLNTTSDAQTIVVSNSGNSEITLGNPVFAPVPASSGFAVTEGSSSQACGGGTFAPGFSCQLNATFTPTVSGESTYSLALAAPNTEDPTPIVTLKGNGVSLDVASLALTQLAPVGTISYGQTIQFQAVITPTGNTPLPSGAGEEVVFSLDGQDYRDTPVVNGVATFTFPLTNAGKHSIAAHYLGDANYPELVSPLLNININLSPSSNQLVVIGDSADPLSVAPDDAVTMTDVICRPTSVGLLQGTASFYNLLTTPATLLSTGTLVFQTAGTYKGCYTAGYTFNGTNGLALGNYVIDAVFSGNSNYLSNTSAQVPFVVTPPHFTLTSDTTGATSTATTPGTMNLVVTDYSNFQAGIDLKCTGLPANAYCVFRPDDAQLLPAPLIIPNTIYPVPIVLQFAVSQNPLVIEGSFNWIGALLTFLLLFVWRRKMPARRVVLTSLIAVACLAGIASLSGCGSSSSSSANPTPKGTYAVVISATATPLTTSGGEPGCLAGAAGCNGTAVNVTQTLNATLVVQ